MPDLETFLSKPFAQEETFTVPEDHNRLVMKLKGHTWVSVSVKDKEIIKDKSSDSIVGFSLEPENYIIRTDGKIESIISKAVEPVFSPLELFNKKSLSMLYLTSDAPDCHVVDGIGEIPADGTSSCTITVKKVSFDGNILTGEEHSDELFLRTTGGILMDSEKQGRTRSIKLKSGKATFTLVSEDHPKIVTVSVLRKNPLLPKAEIQIEFV